MYRTVYWHKTVRIATAMIKKAVLMGMRAGAVVPTDLYGIDDEQFSRLFSKLYTTAAGLVDRVTHRDLYKMVFETDFDGSEQLHLKLTNVQSRLQFEQHLAKRLSKLCGMEVAEEQVIIDIPEPISFEVDLPILTDGGFLPFPKSGSVFTGPVVQGFTRALRKLRLIVAPEVYGPLCEIDPAELLGVS
jgi:HD superfamily phosphohydrolase